MTMRTFLTRTLGAAAALGATLAHAAPVPAPGFLVRSIPTPGVVQGGVVRQGNVLLVGQGAFGAGTETIVRLDGPVATTIATGFNSLGGFDADGGTLYVVDNCFGSDFGCAGATTGDTIYAIADATTRATSVTAGASTVLPNGTITAGQDVLVVPGAVLISDARGIGTGRVIKLVGTMPTNLVNGLDFLGGLATDGSTLFVANLDGDFLGNVEKYTLAGVPAGTLASGLSGSFAVALDGGGNVLVTGGFTNDFSSSTLVAFNSGGSPTEWAHGFSFSSDVFYDKARGEALVLDFGATAVAVVCPDADDDGICDGSCTGPASMAKTKLKIGKQATPVGDDTLKLSGEMTIPALPALDPPSAGARLLVEDADGHAIVDVVVPPGAYDPVTKTGWRPNSKGTTWTYKNPVGELGIIQLAVKTSKKVPGLVKVSATCKHGAYAAAGAALPLRALVSLTAAGQCGLATFTAPGQTCALDPKGQSLTCK
jgi:hypothetical protein